MTQPNLLELAKQGDTQAIASLLNHQLKPKGITAKVALKNACLQIMLESPEVPNQQALVAFIRKGITGLGSTSIEKVKIYGRQIGEEFPSWSQEFEIIAQLSSSYSYKEVNATNEKSPSSLDTEEDKFENSSVNNRRLRSLKTVEDETWNTVFKFLALASIVLFFFNLQILVLIPAILALIAYIIDQNTPAKRALAAKRQIEQEQKAQEEKLNEIRQEETRRISINNAKLAARNLQTNYAETVINEFNKVNARLSVGVNYMDLPGVIASAKLATQQFEKSQDYNVCQYLSELIKKNMFYYELSFECFQRRFNNSIFNTDLETTLVHLFPELQFKTVFANFDIIVQTIWIKASQCSDEIQEIIEGAKNNN